MFKHTGNTDRSSPCTAVNTEVRITHAVSPQIPTWDIFHYIITSFSTWIRVPLSHCEFHPVTYSDLLITALLMHPINCSEKQKLTKKLKQMRMNYENTLKIFPDFYWWEKRKKKYLKISEPSPFAIPHALHLLTRNCIPIISIKQQILSPPHWRPFEH